MESKKIIIPIRCTRYPEQLKYATKLQNIFMALGHEVSVLNIDGEENPLYVQAYLSNEKADLLVTIDCAGFELKLLGDDLFYNSLCIPSMHFLTKEPVNFAEELKERMNFTMEFYVNSDEDEDYIMQHFKRVPCAHSVSGFFDRGMIENYIPSEKIIENVNSFAKVFVDIFINAVETKEKDRTADNWTILENYLKKIGFFGTKEEKTELISFVDLAFLYIDMVEFEEDARYIADELNRIFE